MHNIINSHVTSLLYYVDLMPRLQGFGCDQPRQRRRHAAEPPEQRRAGHGGEWGASLATWIAQDTPG